MKKIILIGDSLRMSYDKYVKDALEGVAEVYYPTENCRYSQYVLRHLHDWKEKHEWPADIDLVHWNAGGWDVSEIYGDPPLSSLEHYADMITRINRRIRLLFPNAKVVFATTSSVVDEQYEGRRFQRHNRVIEEFNATAIKVLEGSGTVINDLYAHSLKAPMEYRSDAVHFGTDEGRAYLGKKVLATICGELNITASEVKLEDFKPEDYTADNIAY
ncbi:MAG: SGNH/GDSL hydrolase family protein [Ruminococcaceae bacterium]|nr:SGNH/GDSL hydrolase family protein [Oscillospiraceae bacterium]